MTTSATRATLAGTTPLLMMLLLTACGEDQAALLGTAENTAGTIEDASFSAALPDGDGEDLAPASFEMAMDLAAEEDVEADLEDDADYAPDCSIEGFKARVIDAYDRNGDHRLGGLEFLSLRSHFAERPDRRHRFARHHRIARLHWLYDSDDSGDLEGEELAELRADLEMRCFNRQAYLLETYDVNGDGELDEDEWALAKEDLQARREEHRAQIIAEFDTNGDGELDHEERKAAFAARREALAERRAALIEEFDVDGDGELDEDEKAALREALKARVRGEYFVDGGEE